MHRDDDRAPTQAWAKTREAVANFKKLLLCSKCSRLLNEPVCLGACEHIVCRSCAAPQIGDGCVVCRSPAWVQDIKINRQLHGITQAFCSLDAILNPTEKSDSSSPTALRVQQAQNSVLKHKKNYKIWFSPRSRKVRCRVEKPEAEVILPPADGSGVAATAAPPPETTPTPTQGPDLSVYNFIPSSSQESDSTAAAATSQRGKNGATTVVGRRKRVTKKAGSRKPAAGGGGARRTPPRKQGSAQSRRLEAVNRQWGIVNGGEEEEEEEDAVRDEEQASAEEKGGRRSSKRVSFVSPDASNENRQPHGPQEHGMALSPGKSIVSLSGDASTVSEDKASSSPGRSAGSFRHDRQEPCTRQLELRDDGGAANRKLPAPDKGSAKRCRVAEEEEEEKESESAAGTPKRPRASAGQSRRRSAHRMVSDVLAPLSPASLMSGRNIKSPRAEKRGSPDSRAITTVRGSSSPGSPGVLKRNHKGETPLHLAAIKGDVEAAKELLDQGADPNLKDHAGWTPLHEACNLGHQAVVEVLVSRGAMLNTPGYQNDSPLHDAVTNGYPAIARLLLQHGASANVLNLHGKRPADYAVTPEMRAVFQTVSEGPDPAGTAITPPASLSSVVARREEQVVLLASKLSRAQQNQVAKLGRLLGGKKAEAFSGSVSHVVVPDGPMMPTTLSTLLGVLAGCWVLRYSWVDACLQAGSWIPEAEYEAVEGPQRSRINRRNLLPPLFDGCFFFLLGSFKAPPKEELVRLLREGGGRLLVRQPKPDSDVTQTLSAAAYHAPPGSDQALCTQYILYEPQQGAHHKPPEVRRGKVWSAPSSWVIDCIAAFRLLPVPNS